MLYHVTAPANVPPILAHGLRADARGDIYAFTARAAADEIARNQLCLPEYALLGIDRKGIAGPVGADRVAEATAARHRVVHQPVVRPEHLTLLGTFVVDPDEPTEWEYRRYKATHGFSRRQTRRFLSGLAAVTVGVEDGEIDPGECARRMSELMTEVARAG